MTAGVATIGHSNTFKIALMWFLLHLFIHTMNDAMTKYLVGNFHFTQIVWLRFLFATLSVLPIMIKRGTSSFYTKHLRMHIIRAILLVSAIYIWSYSLNFVSLALSTIAVFTIPLFTMILAIFFLKEKVSVRIWCATLMAFFGVLISFKSSWGDDVSFIMLGMLIGAIFFSILDIINKKFATREGIIPMVFYVALFATIIGTPTAYIYWEKMPQFTDMVIIAITGMGGNFILYCIIKSFRYASASSLAPFRYLEIIFSVIIGYLLFKDIPNADIIIGIMIIIPCTLFICFEKR